MVKCGVVKHVSSSKEDEDRRRARELSDAMSALLYNLDIEAALHAKHIQVQRPYDLHTGK